MAPGRSRSSWPIKARPSPTPKAGSYPSEQLIRSATWTVYYDASYFDSDDNAYRHQSRTAQGYVIVGGASVILGPISITKTDLDGHVTDQILANYTNSDWATATISRSTYTSWTANIYKNTRLWATAVYNVIPSGSARDNTGFLGAFGTNFTLTAYGYENYGVGDKGRLNKTVAVTSYTYLSGVYTFYGSITRYVLDARGNIKET